MCLKTVECRGNMGVGYKIVAEDYFPLHFREYTYRFKKNKWVHDQKNMKIGDIGCPRYSTGFHVLLNKDDAVYYSLTYGGKIIKVKYKNVVAFGTQMLPADTQKRSLLCVVAKSVMNIGDEL